MGEHQIEARCSCGAQWRDVLEIPDEDLDTAMVTCTACGADTFDVIDLGEVRLRDP